MLICAKKIVNHVIGEGFSFNKIKESIAVKIGAEAIKTNVFATDVC